LKQLCQHPSLKDLPLVTLDAATTEAANKVTGLSVFPCLTPDAVLETDALLSVLQIAAGISWTQPLVVDIATLPDLLTPMVTSSLPLRYHPHTLGFEWCQALIQYLQTGGFRSMMARWAEVLQQIRQQSVDLLICLGESKNRTGVGGTDDLVSSIKYRQF